MLEIKKPLRHAGVMPNYQCSAACRHCLYACSPTFGGGYMSESDMDEMFGLLREGGCGSIHVGGGEPFLDFEGLLTLLNKAEKFGIIIDYIETNAYWATGEDIISTRLATLRKAGGDTLCISVDPFHSEYVPYGYPLLLAELCNKKGFGYFLWQERFLRMLQHVSPNTTHDRIALEKSIGKDFILNTASAYGIRIGGRAIQIEMEYSSCQPLENLLRKKPCMSLVSTDHFHVDMYNQFIPPGCTGLVLPMTDVVRGIESGRYPVYESLYRGGVAALYELSLEYGFEADEKGYTSGCTMCFFIRKFLSELDIFTELCTEHYVEAMKYY
jgi:hypothetical protein